MAEESFADVFDESVRRADPDRWLASRFVADRAARADVITFYAFDAELARAQAVTSNPLIAEIRLAWWRDALEEMALGGPVRAHPLAQALADMIARRGLPHARLQALAEAHEAALAEAALDLDRAMAWADAVAAAGAVIAAQILDAAAPAEAAAPAGRLWGLMVLARQGRTDGGAAAKFIHAQAPAASRAAGALGPAAFPAVAQATLARAWRTDRRTGPLQARLRLTWAVARGRL